MEISNKKQGKGLNVDSSTERPYKVLYTSPLRSLSAERFIDWCKRFSDKKVVMLTGDTLFSEEARKKQMREAAESDIIIATSELLDSVTRKANNPMYEWIHQVGLLVVDESHNIGDLSRGHAIEVGIMRFSKINQNAQIVFLSATMVNSNEIAKWLSLLNGKETQVIFSNWRPVELQFQYYEYPTTGHYWSDENAKISLAADIAMEKPNEQYLIFCHSKGAGRSIVSALKARGENAMFHNADLDSVERSDIEISFESREKDSLRVLVSTPTLAQGRNLPARNVILVGDKRGIEDIDELMVIQMAGRAGRPGYDDAGFVHMVLPYGREGHWRKVFASPRPTISTLKDHRKLAFHFLAEIDNRQITNPTEAKKWYKRSLASMQNVDFTDDDIECLLGDLEKMNMITRSGPWINITGLGKVSAWLYFPPDDVYSWYRNMDRVFQVGQDDLLLGWAIGDIPTNNWGYCPKECKDDVTTFEWQLRNRGVTPTMASQFGLAAYRCLTGDENPNLKMQQRTIQYDIRRINQALKLIDSMWAKWDKNELWDVLPERVMYGIPDEVVFLTRLPGIGGKRAMKLWEHNFRSFDDIVNPKRRGELLKLFSAGLVSKVLKAIDMFAKNKDAA